jgi:hypothetical protein
MRTGWQPERPKGSAMNSESEPVPGPVLHGAAQELTAGTALIDGHHAGPASTAAGAAPNTDGNQERG